MKLKYLLFLLIVINNLKAQSYGWSMLNTNIIYRGSSVSICSDTKGNVYAGGLIYKQTTGCIVYWDGSIIKPLGDNNPVFVNNAIWSICLDTSGNLYAAGQFTNSNNHNYVLKWDKNTNTYFELGGKDSLASKVNISTIYAICTDKYGNVYAAGDINSVAMWTKKTNSWSNIGNSGGAINVLYSDKFGNIYSGVGSYGGVTKWNGSAWTTLGGVGSFINNNDIQTICSDSLNNIYVAGNFTNSSGYKYVAKWDGKQWTELSGVNSLNANGYIKSLFIDKAGILYAVGGFTNLSGNRYVAMWDGKQWSEYGVGSIIPLSQGGILTGLCTDTSGNIYVGGDIAKGTTRGLIAKYGQISNINFTVSGKVVTPTINVVNNTNINYSGSSNGNNNSDTSGSYNLSLTNGNYTIRPFKNNDKTKANGVSALDISLIQNHILGKSLLNSPYKIIAADVNGDGKVSALDIALIKRFILKLDTTFTNSTSGEKRLWAFVDSSYSFTNPAKPFPFKDSISYTNLSTNQTNQTFIGIKLGDVNWDWNPAKARPVNNSPVAPLPVNTFMPFINNRLLKRNKQ